MNFSGGVTNTGAITAHFSAINIATNVTASGGTFTGNIVNTGTLRGASGLRIAVVASSGALNGSSTFNGSIVNTGSIFSSGRNGIHIEKVGAALFSGNISNGGALTATNDTAIAINLLAMGSGGTFSGNIINSGAINSPSGPSFVENFEVGQVADNNGTFLGNIVNTGTISTSHANGIEIQQVGGALFSGNISNSGASLRISAASRS